MQWNQKSYKRLEKKVKVSGSALFALAALFVFAVFFPADVLAATAHLKDSAPEFIDRTQVNYGAMVDSAAQLHDTDAKLILAVIIVESEGNEKVVSRKGAQGLMQLMPKTARAMGAKDLKEPLQNILAGTKYLKELEANYGFSSPGEVLVAYNMGPTRARRWLLRHSPDEYAYVANVMYVYHLLEEKEAAQDLALENIVKMIANEDSVSALRPLLVRPRALSLASVPVSISSGRRNAVLVEN